MFKNIPEVRLGIVAVSRDCFPIDLVPIPSMCRGEGIPGHGRLHLRGPDHHPV